MSTVVLSIVAALGATLLAMGSPRLRLHHIVGTGSPCHSAASTVIPGAHAPGAASADLDSALMLELVGAMLQSGLALPRALEVVSRACPGPSSPVLARAAAALGLGVDWQSAWPAGDRVEAVAEVREALRFAAATGAPSAGLLFARARQLRRRRHRELERRAAALGVRLVVPLGACSLPAFLCLGVVPVFLAMFPSG
ncbi:type II secretion system F family protein [Sinomonas halotolerans]|uniref:Type II secretion system F family protein n=1 Tax=Sinomonas halotolerans TaxID=1644133 RepID=A0ABU9X1H1_9MICC